MKKTRLCIDYTYDFDLIGLISSVRSYKLVWEINRKLGIELAKQPDLEVEFDELSVTGYTQFFFETLLHSIRVFRNIPHGTEKIQKHLVQEYPHMDYIFMSQGGNRPDVTWFHQCLQGIHSVEMALPMPLESLKFKNFFIF